MARLVYAAEVIADDATAVARVHEPGFDPATTALLSADPGCALGPAPADPGAAEVVGHEATHWTIRTTADAPALLVLAENAYPGWEVTIDGAPAEGLTAYTAIRAVCVPAGAHQVEWHFRPRLYLVGAALSLVALLLLGTAIVALRRGDPQIRQI